MIRRLTLLFLAVVVAACGGDSVTVPDSVQPTVSPNNRIGEVIIFEPTWRQDREDLLNWFLGHQRDRVPSLYGQTWGPAGTPLNTLSMSWEGGPGSGSAYFGKGYTKLAAPSWEHYEWDAAFVYLREDLDPFGNHMGFSRGPWFARRARLGDSGRAVGNILTFYDAQCQPLRTMRWEYEWRFTDRGRRDFGGIVGVQDFIVISYIWGTGREERYTYTWEYGWVGHQYIQDGAVVHDWVLNQLGALVPHGEDCK